MFASAVIAAPGTLAHAGRYVLRLALRHRGHARTRRRDLRHRSSARRIRNFSRPHGSATLTRDRLRWIAPAIGITRSTRRAQLPPVEMDVGHAPIRAAPRFTLVGLTAPSCATGWSRRIRSMHRRSCRAIRVACRTRIVTGTRDQWRPRAPISSRRTPSGPVQALDRSRRGIGDIQPERRSTSRAIPAPDSASRSSIRRALRRAGGLRRDRRRSMTTARATTRGSRSARTWRGATGRTWFSAARTASGFCTSATPPLLEAAVGESHSERRSSLLAVLDRIREPRARLQPKRDASSVRVAITRLRWQSRRAPRSSSTSSASAGAHRCTTVARTIDDRAEGPQVRPRSLSRSPSAST